MPTATSTAAPGDSTDRGASASPPPQAPTASAPGPRGAAFIKLYNNALSTTLQSVSYESFAACFPTIAKQAPTSLKGFHADFVGKMEKFAKDEFERILEYRSVVSNLNKLEDLIADARRKKAHADPAVDTPTPPHLHPPATILSAHLAPVYTSQQSQLNAKIQTTSSQNASLAQTIAAQRTEIETLLAQLDNVVADLEEAGNMVGEHGMKLTEEAREAEGVLSET